MNKVLPDFVSASRKRFDLNRIIIRLINDWNELEKSLDSKNIVGAVFIDLSKAFECIPHDLLIAKMSP